MNSYGTAITARKPLHGSPAEGGTRTAAWPKPNGARTGMREFGDMHLASPDPVEARKQAVHEAFGCFSSFLHRQQEKGRIAEALDRIAIAFIARGSLSATYLQIAFPNRAMPVSLSHSDGRKLVSVSITAQKELRFLLDTTEPAFPVFLFIGRVQDAAAFLKGFKAAFSVHASENGHAAFFRPLREYLKAREKYEAATSPRH